MRCLVVIIIVHYAAILGLYLVVTQNKLNKYIGLWNLKLNPEFLGDNTTTSIIYILPVFIYYLR